MGRWLVLVGALSAGLSVGLGAFAAHGLKTRLSPELLATFETAARYQMYHALALVLTGVLFLIRPSPWLGRAGVLFGAGTLLFSGSLYLLVLSGARWLGAITPLGGLAYLAGWLLLAVAALSLT